MFGRRRCLARRISLDRDEREEKEGGRIRDLADQSIRRSRSRFLITHRPLESLRPWMSDVTFRSKSWSNDKSYPSFSKFLLSSFGKSCLQFRIFCFCLIDDNGIVLTIGRME